MNDLQDNKETIEVNADDVIDVHPIKDKIKKVYIANKIERIISDFELLIILIIYIVLSLTVKSPFCPYIKNGWGFWWILFIALPIGPQIYKAIKYKNPALLPIFSIALASYLFIGMITKLWHPYWVLFLLVPVVQTAIKIYKINKFKKALNKNL